MRSLMAWLSLSLLLTVCATAAEVDPIVWSKPEQTVEFRERLAGEEYQTRSRVILNELGDLKSLEQSPLPDHGIRVVRVNGDGQAATLKMQDGDILTKVDQFELWGGAIPNLQARRKVTVFDSINKRSRTVNAEPGRFGINIAAHWRPELAYLRSKERRDAKWDDFVIVGCRCIDSDPDLAETAWSKALKAGYKRDELANICGAVVALNQGRHDEAVSLAWLARDAEPKQAVVVSPIALLRVALANYKMVDAFELCQRFPQQLADEPRQFRMLADIHLARTESERKVAAPSRLAADRYRDDLLPRCYGRTPGSSGLLPKLRERNGVTVSVRSDAFLSLEFAPAEPARDVELSVTFQTLQATPGRYDSSVQVGFTATGNAEDGDEEADSDFGQTNFLLDVAARSLYDRGILLDFGFPVSPTRVDGAAPAEQTRPRTIRVVRVAGQAEVFVDNRRVLYQPVPSTRTSVAALVRIVGQRTKLEAIEFHELLERK
ncbi:MAG: hypothetical protein IAG10_01135 [Planctomycetaceae bacterium]|nr:hypothetical protein [Planctomycetaceae bacterium]